MTPTRLPRWLASPEIVWLALTALAALALAVSRPQAAPPYWIELVSAVGVPIAAIPAAFWLAFAVYADARTQRGLLWLRLWFATSTGGFAVIALGSMTYDAARQPGTPASSGAALIIGVVLSMLVFGVCTAVWQLNRFFKR